LAEGGGMSPAMTLPVVAGPFASMGAGWGSESGQVVGFGKPVHEFQSARDGG